MPPLTILVLTRLLEVKDNVASQEYVAIMTENLEILKKATKEEE